MLKEFEEKLLIIVGICLFFVVYLYGFKTGQRVEQQKYDLLLKEVHRIA